MSSTSSSFAPLQFTGISQYSTDFQQILTRAVSIAQIPLLGLTNEQTTIDRQEATLGNLGSAVSNVTSSLQQIGSLGLGQALGASSTNSTVVTATATGATAPANYSITQVSSLATAASVTSLASYSPTQAVSSVGKMQLVYGSNTYILNLTASNNNVAGVAAAINALGVGVNASVLTPGNSAYLAISANSPGQTTLKLIDNPTGTPTEITNSNASNQGSNTNFYLNGIAVSSPNTTVNSVIPGVTLKFNGTTAVNETVTVRLATDRTQVASALQGLVTSYNTLKSQMDAQFTTAGGPLSGNNILYQIRRAMSSIVQYQGSGEISNLANVGVQVQQNGQLSFDQQTFNSLSDAQITKVMNLLGSTTTGIGGLQGSFSQISAPVTGSIATQTAYWNDRAAKLTAQIQDRNSAISRLQASINSRLQAADASIAALTSQQSVLTASISSLQYVSYGKNTQSA